MPVVAPDDKELNYIIAFKSTKTELLGNIKIINLKENFLELSFMEPVDKYNNSWKDAKDLNSTENILHEKMNRRINSTYLSVDQTSFEPKFIFIDVFQKSKFYIIGKNGHILKLDKSSVKTEWS